MDLLIKNVGLPKNGRLVLAICADGAVYRYFGGKDKRPELKDRIDSAQEYLPNSPAIELPPHGDLILRGGALFQLQAEALGISPNDKDFEGIKKGLLIARKIIIEAPVVLEANNGTDN